MAIHNLIRARKDAIVEHLEAGMCLEEALDAEGIDADFAGDLRGELVDDYNLYRGERGMSQSKMIISLYAAFPSASREDLF
jgi:hypothetical protein